MNWQKGDEARVCTNITVLNIGDIVTIEYGYGHDWVVKDKYDKLWDVFNKNIEPFNFFWLDDFYETVDEFLESFDMDALTDNDSLIIELSKLEPIIEVNMEDIKQMVYSQYESRLGFQVTPEQLKAVDDAFKNAIDFGKLNAAIPNLYFPSGHIRSITKKDLIK